MGASDLPREALGQRTESIQDGAAQCRDSRRPRSVTTAACPHCAPRRRPIGAADAPRRSPARARRSGVLALWRGRCAGGFVGPVSADHREGTEVHGPAGRLTDHSQKTASHHGTMITGKLDCRASVIGTLNASRWSLPTTITTVRDGPPSSAIARAAPASSSATAPLVLRNRHGCFSASNTERTS
jgi:hypothetical protein